jgi:hypothetical protein
MATICVPTSSLARMTLGINTVTVRVRRCDTQHDYATLNKTIIRTGNTVPLTSCLTGLDVSVLQIKTKNVSCQTADSKPVKQEVNCTVILPPLVFPDQNNGKEIRQSA